MADVATWLVALDGQNFGWLVELDPISLVRNKIASDVPELTHSLVALLLERAEMVERAVTWRDELSGLEHPTLATQLGTVLREGDEIERVVALRVLRDSYVEGLEDQLVSIVADRVASSRLRELAASVVVRQRLASHLDPTDLMAPDFFSSDGTAELRGLVLRALWPARMTPQLLEALLVPPPEHYVGSYSLFLSNLGETLTPEFAESVLRWAFAHDAFDRHGWSGRGSVRSVVNEALRTRIGGIPDAGPVPTDVAVALHARLAAGDRKLPVSLSHVSDGVRRDVIRAVAEQFADDDLGWYRLQAARDADGALFITHADVPWMLLVAQEVSDTERALWVRLVDRFLDSERASDMELLWTLRGTSPWDFFRYRFDAVTLDSEVASRAREQLRADDEGPSDAHQVETTGMSAEEYNNAVRDRLSESRVEPKRFWDLARGSTST